MKKLGMLLVLTLIITTVFCSCGKNEMSYDYDLKEYITLGEYPKVDFSEEDLVKEIDNAIEQVASEYKTTAEVTDRPVAKDDVVNIDYVGKMDGKEFEGGSAKGSELKIGSDKFIKGFEDGLIGKNKGDEVVLNLVFPEDYGKKEYAGKDVEFTVKINKITSETIPDLTDKMVSEKTDYKTVDEFLVGIKKELGEALVWDKYVESCKVIKYPETETRNYYNRLVDSYSQMAVYYGTTLEGFVTAQYGYSDVDEFLSYVLNTAMASVKEEMIIILTAKEKNIEISEKEYETKGLELAKEAGYDNLKEYQKAVGKNNIEVQISLDKILAELSEANGIEDVEYELTTTAAPETTETPETTENK